jgi:hypothetical protein
MGVLVAAPAWGSTDSEADRIIARAAQLMKEADRVIAVAQAAETSSQTETAAPASPPEQPPSVEPPPAPTPTLTEPVPVPSPPPAAEPSATPGPPTDQKEAEGAPKEKPAAAAAGKEPTSGAAAQQEEEREVARVPLAAVQAGGLLLPRDSIIVEPTIFYTYSQSTSLVVTGFSVLPLIILGTFESQRTTTNLVSPALQLRYGLWRGLQLDFRIPYTYANTSILRVSTEHAGQVEQSQHDAGIGDITFGLTYQFLYERGWLPDLMVRIGATAPTGQSQFDIFEKIAKGGGLGSAEAFLNALNSSGVALGGGRWTISTSVNGVKALDPGILFATTGWNFTPASTENLIQITAEPVSGGVILQPQLISARLGAVHSFLGSFGLAISLNNQLSVNFSISELISKATTANGVKIAASATNVGQFNFGLNLAVSPTTTLNFLTQIGVTPDAPALSVLMSVPTFYTNVGENAYGYIKEKVRNLFFGKPAVIERPKPKEPTSSGN